MTDNGEDAPDFDALCKACEEGRETLDHQIASLRNIDDKAIRVLRANILFIGLVLTAVSVTVKSSIGILRFVNAHTILGSFLLLCSCAMAAMTFLVTEYEPGISASAIATTVEESLSERQLHVRLSNGYAGWIQYNESALQINGLLATGTIILVIDAIALLTSGAVVGAIDWSRSGKSVGVLIALIVFLLIIDFIVYKIDLWVETHHVLNAHKNNK